MTRTSVGALALAMTLAHVTAGAPAMLIAKINAAVEKGGTTIELTTREAKTSGVRVGLQCDRGAGIRHVLAPDRREVPELK